MSPSDKSFLKGDYGVFIDMKRKLSSLFSRSFCVMTESH